MDENINTFHYELKNLKRRNDLTSTKHVINIKLMKNI